MFRSGFVTVVGRANAGKSTLVNALVGAKVSIVSPKPQTTRNKITGICSGENYQIIFSDTPGFVAPKNAMSKFMAGEIKRASEDAETVLYVLDGVKGLTEEDKRRLSAYGRGNLVVAVNKTDLLSERKIFEILNALSAFGFIKEIVPLSAASGKNTDRLKELLIARLPEGPAFYPEGTLTDRPVTFAAAELIREKLLYALDEEIPHGTGVTLNFFRLNKEKDMYEIDADIVCERSSHKAIIIGKGGQGLKKISTDARLALEKMLGKKVFLTVWVRVKEKWRESESLVHSISGKEDGL